MVTHLSQELFDLWVNEEVGRRIMRVTAQTTIQAKNDGADN